MENLRRTFVPEEEEDTLNRKRKIQKNIARCKLAYKIKVHCTIGTQNRSRTHRSPSLFAWCTGLVFIPSLFVEYIKIALPKFCLTCP